MFSSPAKVMTGGQILLISSDHVLANPNQPRKHFDVEELKSLAESIETNGILQPLTVRKLPERQGYFELISGERRLRASKLVGMARVPCILVEVDNASSAILSLIENLQRQNLNFFEEAEGISKLSSQYGMTQEIISQKLGKAQSTLSNKVRLLKLPPEIREFIEKEGLSERHARCLLRLNEEKDIWRVLNLVAQKHLTVAETEKMVNTILNREVKPRKSTVRVFKDVRIFVNTLNHAVDTMRKAGIEADAAKSETTEYIEYVVRIPKSAPIPVARKKSTA